MWTFCGGGVHFLLNLNSESLPHHAVFIEAEKQLFNLQTFILSATLQILSCTISPRVQSLRLIVFSPFIIIINLTS